MRKLHGVRLPHAKSTAHTPFEILPVPEKVLIPMQMHIGTPASRSSSSART